MTYVALLRGINVGGKNKVEMARLKVCFESLGHSDVVTYINSGNIIFKSDESDLVKLEKEIEKAILKEFKLDIRVILRSEQNIKAVSKATPSTSLNNSDMKTDIMFLWEEIDSPAVLKQLTIKPGIDDVSYVKGAVIWCVDRSNINKSGLLRIVGTDLYRKMTIRNVNTLRKIELIMKSA